MITPDSLNRIAATLPDDPTQDSPVQADIREMLKVFATAALTMPNVGALVAFCQVFEGLTPHV